MIFFVSLLALYLFCCSFFDEERGFVVEGETPVTMRKDLC